MSQELEERVAARLWRAESEDAGAPASIPAGRTLEAFREQREDTKARWHKFARAALAVVREAMAEPTPKMLNAGYAAYWKHSPGEGLAEVFAAMLSASPLGEQ